MTQPNTPAAAVTAFPLPVILPPPRSSGSSSSSSVSSSRSGAATPWTYSTFVEPATTSHTPRMHIGTIDEKHLPLPPPTLEPLRKHETTTGWPRRRAEAPGQALGWLVVLPGLLVALLLAGLATALLLYLVLRRDANAPSFSHGFYVKEMRDASSLYGLLLSTVITHVVWLVGLPMLVSMAAYCVAALWLSYQQRPPTLRTHLLTPLQYGLLFKLFSAPGPGSLYQVGDYLAHPRARIPTPAFFSKAFFLVAGIFGTTYLISAADIWLHAAASVVTLDPTPDASESLLASRSHHDPIPSPTVSPPAHSLGHYPLAPTLIYLTLVYLHALLALVLTLITACLRSPPAFSSSSSLPLPATATTPGAPRAPTLLRLAHLHLTDVLAPVAARLSGRHALYSFFSSPSSAAAAFSGGQTSSKRTPTTTTMYPYLKQMQMQTQTQLARALFVEDANTARVEVGVWVPDPDLDSGRGGEDETAAAVVVGQKGVGGGLGRSISVGAPAGKTKGRGRESKASRRGYGQARGGDGVLRFGVYKKIVPYKGEIY